MNETQALIILNAIPGIGNRRILNLIEYFGSASKAVSSTKSQISQSATLPEDIINNFLNFPQDKFLKNETQLMQESKARVITIFEDEYPQLLKEIPDAPAVLYVKGKIPEDIKLSMAIVGSRKASIYGISTAEKLSMQLSELGFCVISGLARGIDTAAHRGVLKAHGSTIAVLGSGLSSIYPEENIGLAKTISENGAVISEFPMQALPKAYHFPRRNRIVSGLSQGVIVVEAAKKSGALITADLALEQGREVFAIPGKVDTPSSFGVNNLIKQGAKLIMSVDDILEELRPHITDFLDSQRPLQPKEAGSSTEDKPLKNLTQEEKHIYRYINERPIHIDDLVSLNESELSATGSILLQLEMKQYIKQLPGKFFKRR